MRPSLTKKRVWRIRTCSLLGKALGRGQVLMWRSTCVVFVHIFNRIGTCILRYHVLIFCLFLVMCAGLRYSCLCNGESDWSPRVLFFFSVLTFSFWTYFIVLNDGIMRGILKWSFGRPLFYHLQMIGCHYVDSFVITFSLIFVSSVRIERGPFGH